MRIRVVGDEFDVLLEGDFGFFEVPHKAVRVPELVVGRREFRGDGDGFFVSGDGRCVLLLAEEVVAQQVVSPFVAGELGDELLVEFALFHDLAVDAGFDAQDPQALSLGNLISKGAGPGEGVEEALRGGLDKGEQQVGLGEVGIQFHGFFEVLDRFRPLEPVAQAAAFQKRLQRLRRTGGDGYFALFGDGETGEEEESDEDDGNLFHDGLLGGWTGVRELAR